MKTVVVGALALLLGIFLGGYGPRSELETARSELEKVRGALVEAKRGQVAMPLALGLGSLLAAQRPTPPVEATPAPPSPAPTAEPAHPPTEPERDDGEPGDGGAHGAAALRDPKAFEALRAAAALQSSQHRQAFREAARLDGAREARLDELIGDMNAQVAAEADRLAALIGEQPHKPSTRNFVDAMVGLAQVYQRSDDRLQALLDPSERAAAEKTRFDLMTQLDPGSFQALALALSSLDNKKPEPQP